MKIEKTRNSSELTIAVEGRIDAKTAPELESVLDEALDGVTGLTFDLKQVTYISSAGLRVFLKVQKQMNAHGKMKVINANEALMEIFEVTGFNDILNIE